MNTTHDPHFFEDHLDWWLERYLFQDDDAAALVPIIEEDSEELWLISD